MMQLKGEGATEPLTAITAIATEKQFDETEFAKLVVAHSGLDWKTVKPTSEDFVANLEEVVATQEEPFSSPSIFMQYFVMQEAKASGCKVMLDGQGGDETLLGYQKYYPTAYLSYAKKYGWLEALKEVQRSSKNNSRMSVKWILLYTGGTFLSGLRAWQFRRRASVVKRRWREMPKMSYFRWIAKSAGSVFQTQQLEITKTNLPVLLRYEDKNSMRNSIEARLPFLDYRFVEFAINMPAEHKIHNGWTKFILRKSMEEFIPARIAWRKDNIGFNAPEATWLAKHGAVIRTEVLESSLVNEICDRTELEQRFDSLDNKFKWRLFNLATWSRLFHVNW